MRVGIAPGSPAARKGRWLRRRLRQVAGLMSPASAVRFVAMRHRPVVTVRLKAAASRCTLRPRSSDLDCLYQIFVRQEYRLPFQLAPRTIVDAGANIGGASLYFARQYPAATIFAIEPEPGNYELLKKNCAHLANVIPIQAALWPEARAVTVVDPDAEKWAFAVKPADGEENAVRGLDLDTLMQEFSIENIDLLKLDIEGAEQELFGGRNLTWLDQVDVIIVELHDRYRPGCAAAFYSALYGRRFTQWVCGENVIVQLRPGLDLPWRPCPSDGASEGQAGRHRPA